MVFPGEGRGQGLFGEVSSCLILSGFLGVAWFGRPRKGPVEFYSRTPFPYTLIWCSQVPSGDGVGSLAP